MDDKPNVFSRRNAGKTAFKVMVGSAATLIAAMRSEKAVAGYGRCSSCGCAGYSGSGYICSNCGHNYQAHW